MTTISSATHKTVTAGEFAQLFASKDELTIQKGDDLTITDVDITEVARTIAGSQNDPQIIRTQISHLFRRLLQPVGKELIVGYLPIKLDSAKRCITLSTHDGAARLQVQKVTKVFSAVEFANLFREKDTHDFPANSRITVGPIKDEFFSKLKSASAPDAIDIIHAVFSDFLGHVKKTLHSVSGLTKIDVDDQKCLIWQGDQEVVFEARELDYTTPLADLFSKMIKGDITHLKISPNRRLILTGFNTSRLREENADFVKEFEQIITSHMPRGYTFQIVPNDQLQMGVDPESLVLTNEKGFTIILHPIFKAALPLFHTYYYTGSTSKTPNKDFRFNIGVEDRGVGNSFLMRINACATLRLHLWCSKGWKEEKYVRAYVFNFVGKPLAALFDAAANVALLVIKICAAIFIFIGKKIQKAWNPSLIETSFSIRMNLRYQMEATAISIAYLIYQVVTQTVANWGGPSGDSFFDVEDSLFIVERPNEVFDKNRKRYLNEVCRWDQPVSNDKT